MPICGVLRIKIIYTLGECTSVSKHFLKGCIAKKRKKKKKLLSS